LPRRRLIVPLIAALAVLAAACGSASGSSGGGPVTLRLGYFPNITHATALVGVDEGIFAAKLRSGVTLETTTFNAGPAAVEALFAGAIDATYIGPNPAINAYVKSKGEAVRIVSGATSGGSFLVVRPGIASAAALTGTTLATPQLGNTQDVALRTWLAQNGLKTDTNGGGDVSIKPQDNAQTLDAFKAKAIDGAWVPEPWATRLVREGGARVLVDERTLWPGGKYATTVLLVRTAFMKDHPDVVRRLVEGQVAANDAVAKDPARAQKAANDQIEKITGKRLSNAVLASAWKNLTFTDDPVASSLTTSAANATTLGLLDPVDLKGIFDLTMLDQALAAAGEPTVGAP
jgi:NitT/TauT family transport system substrate-binding protein